MTTRTVLIVAIVLAVAIVLSGCAPAAPSAAATKDACFRNMALIHTEIDLFHADSGVYPPLADVVKQLGSKCPSGGAYAFDEKTDVVSCSIHGAYKP